MRNHSNENEFDLHENGRVGENHFHMNSFVRRLVLTQRQRVTRKWPILVLPDQSASRIQEHQMTTNQRPSHNAIPSRSGTKQAQQR